MNDREELFLEDGFPINENEFSHNTVRQHDEYNDFFS
jgi:hypothetical protein